MMIYSISYENNDYRPEILPQKCPFQLASGYFNNMLTYMENVYMGQFW